MGRNFPLLIIPFHEASVKLVKAELGLSLGFDEGMILVWICFYYIFTKNSICHLFILNSMRHRKMNYKH